MPLAINSKPEFVSTKPIYSKVWILPHSISLCRILPTSVNPKKTRCNSKSANSNRAMRFSQAPTGLEVIERLIPQAHAMLKPGGWLIIEISGTIADRVKHLLSTWKQVQITNDLQGIPRVAAAQKS